MKFVFINSLPTSKLFGEKFDAWWYSRNGFDVAFWDVAPVFWSEAQLEQYYGGKSDYRYIGPGHQSFSDRGDVVEAISALPEDAAVWYLGRFYPLVPDDWIFEALHRHRLRYYLQHFDTRIESPQLLKRLRCGLGNVKHRFVNRGLLPRGVVGSGRVGRSQSRALFPDARFISIPSIKVEWQPAPPVRHEPYNLFVDESVDYAPDARMFNYVVCHDTDAYYARLNRLFDDIEAWSGTPVVIAASGKYQYQRDRFEGREVVYGQTLSLIQNAGLVMGHMSLALDQCLASEKPALTIDDPDFTEVKRAGFSDSLLNLLQKPQLVTEVTRQRYMQALNPNLETVRRLVHDYLREEGVNPDHCSIVKNELLSS